MPILPPEAYLSSPPSPLEAPHGLSEEEIIEICIVAGIPRQGWESLSSGIKMNLVQKYFNHLKKKEKREPFLFCELKGAFAQQLYNDVAGEIGLEIECEGKHLFGAPIQYWKAVQDHSLRNVEGHPPLEYVLRAPIHRDSIMPALDYLDKGFKDSGSELRFSHRTSVHVHVNCLHMKMKDIFQFLCLYFIFEDLLVEFSGTEREGNLFCLRAKDAEFQIEILIAAAKTYNFSEVFNTNFRYSACNVSSMGTHGSLEFRSMRGTTDKSLIEAWVLTLLAIKDQSLKYRNPAEISRAFTSLGPMEFLYHVTANFPSLTKNWILHHENLRSILWTSYRTMRDLAHAIDWDDPPKIEGSIKRFYPQEEDNNEEGD